jgi:hypothetical protein
MQYVIYGLFDPNTKELRYIGKTNNIKNRLRQHYNPCNLKSNTHKNNWLKCLAEENKKADVEILEIYSTYEELNLAEIELIEYYKYIGCNLVNGTLGGEGCIGHIVSEETRQKLRIARANQAPPSEEARQKFASFAKNIKANLGKKFSEEHKRKLSESHKGKKRGQSKLHGKTWKVIDNKRVWINKE